MVPLSVRAPRGRDGLPAAALIQRDPDVLASFLEDAAHFPGGHATGVAMPASEVQVVELIKSASAVLPIGAQSSLTGGATPMGETVLSTARLNRILDSGDDWIHVEAGLTLTDLDAALAEAGKYYPPAPTFMGAFVGGTVATNAAGAATFKYGTTREWVVGLTVILANGDVLEIRRGETVADASGTFHLALSDGHRRIPVPRYRMPHVPKLAAGYFAAPGMDLIDLFIGSEGTLGVVTDVTLRVLPQRPAMCLSFVPFRDRRPALAFVRRLRDAARGTWERCDPAGLDVSAIEHMDARCLAILREDGLDRQCGVQVPPDAAIALLITLELPAEMTTGRAFDEIGGAREAGAPDVPLVRFCRALDEAGVLDAVEVAVPGDLTRAGQLLALREAVPAAVNARIGRAKRDVNGAIAKTAADMIVPFERIDELLTLYDEEFRRLGLDAAIWGHISDGNLHPNVIPRSVAEMECGRAAILAFGREVIRLGGSPLAEHGVGRNPVKQQLLLELYGDAGIADMRAVKRALDPEWKLAPGVLFPKP